MMTRYYSVLTLRELAPTAQKKPALPRTHDGASKKAENTIIFLPWEKRVSGNEFTCLLRMSLPIPASRRDTLPNLLKFCQIR
jgi:hypothetical protein